MQHSRKVLIAVAAFALAAAMMPAHAAAPSPDRSVGHSSEVLGVVHVHGFAGGGGAGGNLSYHNGPVLRTNKTFSIYWGTGFAPGYAATINTYLADTAAASGSTTSVYSVETQYYDTTGKIAYASSYSGTANDPIAPPTTCSDSVSQTTTCVSDASIQAEVQAMIPNPDPTTVYFVFTGPGVGSCFAASSCAFSQYCAYHGHFTGTNGKTYLYANQPYTMTVPSACDSGKYPNGQATQADATINVVSHEHREAINDAFGNAWYDRRGYEGSDKCAWNFGTALGSDYNQVINGHHYYLQQEWSNKISGCALHP